MAKKGKFTFSQGTKAAAYVHDSILGYERMIVCGSYRRRVETIGDLDIYHLE